LAVKQGARHRHDAPGGTRFSRLRLEELEDRRMLSGLQVLHTFGMSEGEYPEAELTLDASTSTFYGTTSSGPSAQGLLGTNCDGAIFSVKTNGTGFAAVYSFSGGDDGAEPHAALTLISSTLYGTTERGGNDNDGIIFSIHTDGADFQVLYSFTGGADGEYPQSALTPINSTTLVGTASQGGSDWGGTVFSINISTGSFQVLHAFSGGAADGAGPMAGLTLVGSTLYGTTQYGGSDFAGTIYSMDTTGGNFQVVHSFSGADGAYPTSGLTLAGSTLYGTAELGGGGGENCGTIFSLNTSTDAFQVLHTFSYAATDGGVPDADLTLVGSNLYGTTNGGGSDNGGTVFSLGTNGSNFHLLHSFTDSDGEVPCAGLALDRATSTLFGTASEGGSADDGTLFSIRTNGSGFHVLHSFTGATDGLLPADLTLDAATSTLYGTAIGGGDSSSDGTIFSIGTDGTGFQVLHVFSKATDGADPNAALTLVGSTLYGAAAIGGADNDGTIFSINTDGSNLQVLHSFSGTDGAGPLAGLTLVGSTLFGTTASGGTDDDGTIFSFNIHTGRFQVLHSFSGTAADGANPYAGLTLIGSTLYGTTQFGGSGRHGTIFSISTGGSNFQVLYSFTGYDDGGDPQAGLTPAGSTLYGAAEVGGSSGDGTIFSLNTSTGSFQVLHTFSGADGAYLNSNLTLDGSTLFGTAAADGANLSGTVFSLGTDGSNFQVLYSFTGDDDGRGPSGGLTLAGSTLFGTTEMGGSKNGGTLFSLALPASQLVFTAEPGNTMAGVDISPAVKVSVEDAYGDVVTTDNSNVTVTLAANPGSGTLEGTLTVAAVNGVATFSNVAITTLGTGYTLTATDGSLTAATSTRFNVTARPSQNFAFLSPDPLDPTEPSLYVYGTNGNDVIQVSPATGPGTAAGAVTVEIDGKTWGPFSPTGRIIIYGFSGNDYIGVSSQVSLPAWLYAGGGNDVLWGGGGPTILFGGTGNSTFWGGNGRSILIGGSGKATLVGGAGDALLIAGTTAYDSNDAALEAILNEWDCCAAYAARLACLTGAAGGLNGSYDLTSATVSASKARDTLLGGNGNDVFFEGLGDTICGRRATEALICVPTA
jgi:uncharacterized repeat protein (TIGR03803 family)